MKGQRLRTIEGAPPNLERLPDGCSFAPRCTHATDRCRAEVPVEVQGAPGRMARCTLIGG